MAASSRDSGAGNSSVLTLLIAMTVGALAVLASIFGAALLVGDSATRAAELERMTAAMYWTQPFIYAMAGLLVGSGDTRGGSLRAPVVGLVLASIGWLTLRNMNLLPGESNAVAYLMTASALFALGGAMIAPLIKDHVGKVVGGIIVVGLMLFVWAFLNLGAISGKVERDVITRVQGQATKWVTVGVPNADVALLDRDQDVVLYTTKTSSSGRYHISGVPIGNYRLRVWDPRTADVMTDNVTVQRSITGGTRWESVALTTLTEETGPLFE